MGLLKAIVGGTVGLVVGTMTCAPNHWNDWWRICSSRLGIVERGHV